MLELDPSRTRPVPWRNGAGATRELAVATDTDGALLWRISVADLNEDAVFSAFPDIDRVFLALGDVRLDIDGVVERLEAGQQLRFRGESSTSVLVARPTRALNIMTRRGLYVAELIRRRRDQQPTQGAAATVRLGDLLVDLRLTSLLEGSR